MRLFRRFGPLCVLISAGFLAGCGVGNDVPLLADPSIVVSGVAASTFTISWTAATNEPGFGRGFVYEIYVTSYPVQEPAELANLTPSVRGNRAEFGTDPASASLIELTPGAGYFINISVVNDKSGDRADYDQALVITTGGPQVNDAYDGSTSVFNRPATGDGDTVAVNYSIDVGITPQDVFVVFSNPGSGATQAPVVIPGSYAELDFNALLPLSGEPQASGYSRAVSADSPPIVVRDRPGLYNPQPSDGMVARGIVPQPPFFVQSTAEDSVGDVTDFYDDSTTNTIRAINRFANPNIDGTGLSIWVEESEWSGGTVSQAMINDLAATFLQSGPDNDIFDWLTGIYGDEWGDAHPFNNLIPNENHVTILLYDIPSDPGTIVAGYFWSKDNFKASDITYSNERVMFYLSSQLLALDFQEAVSTIAHEFQHMIHFYQRSVRLNAESQTWFNEMMSLVSEDLVSRKMYLGLGEDIAGPRGVAPSHGGGSGSAGPANNDVGRLPGYNQYPETSLTAWSLSGESVLRSYSTSYSFGAYLARNFGGADLFSEIMSTDPPGNDDTEEEVLSLAIEATTAGDADPQNDLTLGDLLWRWGAAVLLSDDTSAPNRLRTNTGSWITNGAFDLGSINYFNYPAEEAGTDGPIIYGSQLTGLPSVGAVSNIFFQLGDGVTGTLETVLLMPTGFTYTVVVK